ncbi:hypothetical protein [Actinomycetospora cinnamomea]|uniref:Uncharacterized protein n=1 Tax=Actinomycetospora cinnamomea TaxID=663609 RepID=A0A2U1F270_9PSEU|nr:hypothetical protein [Actinomycetospora cinnamomea]PVZ06277.1 hypothetical protein C8D89_11315 [Actinomycetospora cinnamomea]
MTPGARRAVTVLTLLAAALAAGAATAGLAVGGGPGRQVVVTPRGVPVVLDGTGLYRWSGVFAAAGQRGTDLVVLVLVVPLLVIALVAARRGSVRARLLLVGLLVVVVYVHGSIVAGTIAYTPLYVVSVLVVPTAGTAVAVLVAGIARHEPLLRPGVPRRGPGLFLLASALVTVVVWGVPLVVAAATGTVPARTDLAAAPVTLGLDLAVITPLVSLAAVLLLRGAPQALLLAVPLLVLEISLAPVITAQTASQLASGVRLEAAEVAGPIGGFAVLALGAAITLVALLRAPSPSPLTSPQPASAA